MWFMFSAAMHLVKELVSDLIQTSRMQYINLTRYSCSALRVGADERLTIF